MDQNNTDNGSQNSVNTGFAYPPMGAPAPVPTDSTDNNIAAPPPALGDMPAPDAAGTVQSDPMATPTQDQPTAPGVDASVAQSPLDELSAQLSVLKAEYEMQDQSIPTPSSMPADTDPLAPDPLAAAQGVAPDLTAPATSPTPEMPATSDIGVNSDMATSSAEPVAAEDPFLSAASDPNNSATVEAPGLTPDLSSPSIADMPQPAATDPVNSPDPFSTNNNMSDMGAAPDPLAGSADTSTVQGMGSAAVDQPESVSVDPMMAAATPMQVESPVIDAPPATAIDTNNADPVVEISEVNVAQTTASGQYPYTIEQLLDMVIERDASDLHITVGYPVMLRVDGTLVATSQELVTVENANDLILPVLSEQKKELLEVNREVDLAYAHNDEARFRINAYYQKESLAAAFRLIPNRIKTLEELKVPQIYHQLAKLRQGLVLVTGPTGSGKSTTLAAILQDINLNRAEHMITIEDPIEYVFPRAKSMVDQREMHEDTHSWEIALKSAMRQDPDVVLVGEMRDYETISAAITLAETGHLVFATLHTNSAAQTMDRIIDVFPEGQQSQIRSQLSNVIEAVVAQRLIPIQNGGRRAVSEIMIATPAVRNLVREGKTHQLDNVIRTSADIGMISLEQSLVKLVRENLITMDKAQEYAVHPEEVVRLLKG